MTPVRRGAAPAILRAPAAVRCPPVRAEASRRRRSPAHPALSEDEGGTFSRKALPPPKHLSIPRHPYDPCRPRLALPPASPPRTTSASSALLPLWARRV